jgi:uncharacterized membrane protein YraQ (UPF0718 family)
MIDQVQHIVHLVLSAFLHIWPYLLLTIPLAVVVQMSGASKYITRAFQGRPIVAICLATAVGAFSPFCSCGVIPVIAALLIGGVPLAPVMSFWIASPSMDPEAFFLSVATLGWELAVWRLAATLVLSLSAGLLTHVLKKRGWLGQQTLRARPAAPAHRAWARLRQGWRTLGQTLVASSPVRLMTGSAAPAARTACGSASEANALSRSQAVNATNTGCGTGCGEPVCNSSNAAPPAGAARCSVCEISVPGGHQAVKAASTGCDDGCGEPAHSSGAAPDRFWRRLLVETLSATSMVVKFMALAFLIDALIKLYVPQEWVAGLLGGQNPWAIVTAALLGVPAYASNMTALPMIGGLLAQGMHPAAALAFLIAGPTTTLPAMAAVQGLTTRRIFALYVFLTLAGAVVSGYAYSLAISLF